MQEERMRVLRMVEEGKVTPEEGARLLDAIRTRAEADAAVEPSGRGRCLCVRVFEGDQDEPKVNVTVPLALGRLALRFIPRAALEKMEEEGIRLDDLDEIISSVERAGPFRLVDIQDGSDKVQVVIE